MYIGVDLYLHDWINLVITCQTSVRLYNLPFYFLGNIQEQILEETTDVSTNGENDDPLTLFLVPNNPQYGSVF
jgi:hypothetical protein